MLCSKPFRSLEVGHRNFTACCTAWLAPEARIVQSDLRDPWAIWNHPAFQRLRQAALDDDDRFCKTCPWLISGTTPKESRESAVVMTRPPAVLAVCSDCTCNLHCWSCRRHPIRSPGDWSDRRDLLLEMLRTFGPDLEVFSTSQTGDAFASPVSMAALQSKPLAESPAKIRICTNGLLMARVWPTLPDATRSRLWAVHISIDAATPSTYERLRRGGTWAALVRALEFLAELRQTGQLPILIYQFCTQSDNFREMPAFVELALRHQATRIIFTMLRPFDLPAAEYQQHSLARSEHPLRAEFLRVLEDARLRDPHVDWQHLNPAVQRTIDRQYQPNRPSTKHETCHLLSGSTGNTR